MRVSVCLAVGAVCCLAATRAAEGEEQKKGNLIQLALKRRQIDQNIQEDLKRLSQKMLPKMTKMRKRGPTTRLAEEKRVMPKRKRWLAFKISEEKRDMPKRKSVLKSKIAKAKRGMPKRKSVSASKKNMLRFLKKAFEQTETTSLFPTLCTEGHRACNTSGECLPVAYWCDGQQDCRDNADEADCPAPCPETEFHCTSGGHHGSCIPGGWRCDNITDCAQNEDEQGCLSVQLLEHLNENQTELKAEPNTEPTTEVLTQTTEELTPPTTTQVTTVITTVTEPPSSKIDECQSFEFSCPTGTVHWWSDSSCIVQDWVCDGYSDCNNGEDEQGCDIFWIEECQTNQFSCLTGNSWGGSHCISQDWVCDGEYDCNSGEDEQGCDFGTAVSFCCPSGAYGAYLYENVFEGNCVPASWRCDGYTDCHDGEDEQGCTGSRAVQTKAMVMKRRHGDSPATKRQTKN